MNTIERARLRARTECDQLGFSVEDADAVAEEIVQLGLDLKEIRSEQD